MPYDSIQWRGASYILGTLEEETGKLPQGESWGQACMVPISAIVETAGPEMMAEVYPAYHTLSADMAVDRLLEARSIHPAM